MIGRSQGGVVLLSVLLVLALLSAIAWQLMGRHSLVIAQARHTFTGDQSLEYALGAEAFARQVLFEDWSQGGAAKDTLLEPWAQAAPPFEVDNGFIELQIVDMHRCFNLNSLAGGSGGAPGDFGGAPGDFGGAPGESGGWQENMARLKNLLRNRNVPEELAEAWRDWVDPDQEISGFGAEDGEYLLESPPYRTANARAAHASEFRLLRGVEREHIEALGDALCVLPTTDLDINLNTADPAVLASLSPALSEVQMQALTESVRDYDDPGAVISEFPDLAGVGGLGVTSEYFRVDVRASVDESRTELSTLLRRDPTSGLVQVVSRDLGRDFQTLFTAETEEE